MHNNAFQHHKHLPTQLTHNPKVICNSPGLCEMFTNVLHGKCRWLERETDIWPGILVVMGGVWWKWHIMTLDDITDYYRL